MGQMTRFTREKLQRCVSEVGVTWSRPSVQSSVALHQMSERPRSWARHTRGDDAALSWVCKVICANNCWVTGDDTYGRSFCPTTKLAVAPSITIISCHLDRWRLIKLLHYNLISANNDLDKNIRNCITHSDKLPYKYFQVLVIECFKIWHISKDTHVIPRSRAQSSSTIWENSAVISGMIYEFNL